jgi:hypothetical protein
MEFNNKGSKHASGPVGLDTDERIGSLFQPDTVLAAQYLDTVRRKIILEPEKQLLLAVLEDGINCFQENVAATTAKRKQLFAEAEDWILDSDRDWLFSFENACDVLGLNPAYLRQGLLRWKLRKLQQSESAVNRLSNKLAS